MKQLNGARTRLVAGVCLLLLVAGLVGLRAGRSSSSSDGYRYRQATAVGSVIPLAQRRPAGPLQAPLLADGQQFKLADNVGKVVVLGYFASWCGPCNIEMPQLDLLYRQRKAAGVALIGVDVKDSTQQGSRAWVADRGISFPVLWDQPTKTAIQIGRVPITVPGMVVLDRRARVAAVYLHPVTPADLAPVLDTLQAES